MSPRELPNVIFFCTSMVWYVVKENDHMCLGAVILNSNSDPIDPLRAEFHYFQPGKHFCFCLVILVLSTLQSMVLTRLAKCGTLQPCSLSKSKDSLLKDTEESKSDIKASEEENMNTHLQKVVKFLNKMAAQDQKKAIHLCFANKVDLICFCIYLTVLIVYAVVILYFFFGSQCQINQLDFWS